MATASLQRIWQAYQRDGGLALLERAAQKPSWPARLAGFGSLRVLHLTLASLNARVLSRPVAGFRLDAGRPDDIEAAVCCLPAAERDSSQRLFRSFVRDGARFVLARYRGGIAGFAWAFVGHYVVTYDGYQRTAVRLELPGRAAFLGNGFIAEEHRMRGLFPHLLRAAMSLHPGTLDFYSASSASNRHSLASHDRLGFTAVADLSCVRILGWPQYFYRDLFWRRGWRRLSGPGSNLRKADWCVTW